MMHVPTIAARTLPAFTASRELAAAAAGAEVVVLFGGMALRYAAA
jgi:hypothetical protein